MIDRITRFFSDSKKRKTVIFVAVAIVAVAFIISLFKPESNTHLSNDITSPQGVLSNSDDPQKARLYKEYDEYFVVDADITTSVPETAAILYAQYATYDKQLLLDVFFKDKSPTCENITTGLSGIYIQDGATGASDGSSLLHNYNSGSTGFGFYSNSAVKLPTESLFTKYDYILFSGSMNTSYAAVYKKKALEFMSSEAAIAEAKSVLDGLSITVSDNVEIYAIDCETMQNYQDNELELNPSSRNNYDIKDVFTIDDEFYILDFTVTQNGIPLSHRYYEQASSGRQVYGTNVRLYVSNKGVTYLNADGILEILSESEIAGNFISAEEAIDAAYKKFSSFVYDTPMLVTDAEFVYIAVPYNEAENEVMLVPAWDIILKYNGGIYEGYDVYTSVTVDAVTGEEIK